MKKVLIIVGILAVLAIAAYIYVTRAPSLPSQDVALATETLATSSDAIVYRISPDRSLVRFEIDETLRGNPFTVVGTTTQIAGDLAIGAESITLGTVKVNARSFQTDDARRDGAIARLILKSEDAANEFISFKPKSFDAEGSSVDGDTFTLVLDGDLTISGVTKPARVTAMFKVGEATIEGTFKSTLKRSDFGLVIPNIPFVADVPDQFTVSGTVVAERVM